MEYLFKTRIHILNREHPFGTMHITEAMIVCLASFCDAVGSDGCGAVTTRSTLPCRRGASGRSIPAVGNGAESRALRSAGVG